MKKLAMIATLAVLSAVLVSPATAGREWRGGYGSGPGRVADVAEIPGLDLTTDQARRIRALREAQLEEIRPLQEDFIGKSRELRRLWLEKFPDRERILLLQEEVQELRTRMTNRLMGYHREAEQLLTPEQRERMQSHRPERGMGPGGPVRMDGVSPFHWEGGRQIPGERHLGEEAPGLLPKRERHETQRQNKPGYPAVR